MLLNGGVGGCASNSHGNYIVDHGTSWKNHRNVILNFCGNPDCNFIITGSSGATINGYLIDGQIDSTWLVFSCSGTILPYPPS